MDGVRNPCEQFVLLGDWDEWCGVFRNTTWLSFGIDNLHKQFPIRFVLIGDPNEWCSVFCTPLGASRFGEASESTTSTGRRG